MNCQECGIELETEAEEMFGLCFSCWSDEESQSDLDSDDD